MVSWTYLRFKSQQNETLVSDVNTVATGIGGDWDGHRGLTKIFYLWMTELVTASGLNTRDVKREGWRTCRRARMAQAPCLPTPAWRSW